MTEVFEGETACFKKCPINHRCFGGYLEYDELCGKEFARMKKMLEAAFPAEDIQLQAVNGKGLWFTRDKFQCVVQNEGGVWVKRDKPKSY